MKVVALGALAFASAFAPPVTPSSAVRTVTKMNAQRGTMKMQMTSVTHPHEHSTDRPPSGSGRRTSALPPLPSSLRDIETQIPELFKTLDNGSGMLSVNQLEQVFSRHDMKHTWKGSNSAIDQTQSLTYTEMLFRRADHDGNGLLDYEEFERLMNWHAWQHLCSHRFQPSAEVDNLPLSQERTLTVELRKKRAKVKGDEKPLPIALPQEAFAA